MKAYDQQAYERLIEATRGYKRRDLFSDYHVSHGYKHYMFRGIVTGTLVKCLGRMPTGNEVLMLVDNGIPTGKVQCMIDVEGRFCGKVCDD